MPFLPLLSGGVAGAPSPLKGSAETAGPSLGGSAAGEEAMGPVLII
jgi:hypothetical protein